MHRDDPSNTKKRQTLCKVKFLGSSSEEWNTLKTTLNKDGKILFEPRENENSSGSETQKVLLQTIYQVVRMLPSAPNKYVAVVVKIFMLIYLTTAT